MDLRKKIAQVHSGAWGKVTVGVDSCGRFRSCSAGMDLLPYLNLFRVGTVQYVKVGV